MPIATKPSKTKFGNVFGNILQISGGGMASHEELGISDTSSLTDADWAAINELRRISESDGDEALERALRQLLIDDSGRAIRILGAFFPERVREALKDTMAETGMTLDDLKEMFRKANPPPTKQ